MKEISKKNSGKNKKLSIIAAILLGSAIILIVPVYAWFAYQAKVETMSKINEPPELTLASGKNDSIQMFEIGSLDVSSTGTKDFVFSVETGKTSEYDLQLAHTTNIPFAYSIFRVKEDGNGTIVYSTTDANGDPVSYKYSVLTGTVGGIPQDITLNPINQDDNAPSVSGALRPLGDEDELPVDRKNYAAGTDEVDVYVEPLYSVARNIGKNTTDIDNNDDRDYFVLRVSWNVNPDAEGDAYWNYADNNKETDIIYITVKESGQD